MERKSIGSFIAVLRKANGFTQRELADKLGVSDKAVSRWERDETAPDLYLIPVIAEIFGVTSDELLRGERASEIAPQKNQNDKTERQIKNVLKTARTKFLTKSLICALIAVIGLLAAMLCNFAFYRAELGFYVGFIFFVISAVIEIIFAVLAVSSLDAEEFDGEHLTETRKYIIKKTETIVFLSFILLSYCMPLIIEAGSTSIINIRVDFPAWLIIGAIFAAIAGIICAIANIIVDKISEKKGIYIVDEKIAQRRYLAKKCFASPLSGLAKVFVPLVAVTIAAHVIGLNVFNYEFFLRGKGTEWTDPNAFVAYMEESIRDNGISLDEQYTVYPTYEIWVHTAYGTHQIEFEWNNRYGNDFVINGTTARDVERGHNGTLHTYVYPDGEIFPDNFTSEIYDIPGFHAITYSQEEAFDAREWSYDIHTGFVLAYIAEGLALAITYTVMVIKKFKETKQQY